MVGEGETRVHTVCCVLLPLWARHGSPSAASLLDLVRARHGMVVLTVLKRCTRPYATPSNLHAAKRCNCAGHSALAVQDSTAPCHNAHRLDRSGGTALFLVRPSVLAPFCAPHRAGVSIFSKKACLRATSVSACTAVGRGRVWIRHLCQQAFKLSVCTCAEVIVAGLLF
jgi:hypothetical protein